MARYFGIDFVPLDVPLKRRLQTLVILIHTLNFSILPLVCVGGAIFLLFTRLWFIVVGYGAWMYYDVCVKRTPRRGGRRSDRVRQSWFVRHFRDYFPISLHKTADLPPDRNYLVGYHPHGIISCGAIANFGSDVTGFSKLFPGIRAHLLTLDVNFKIPILRAYVLWLGLCDVSKESINWILSKQGTGNAAVIVIGGAAEALDAHPGSYKLTLAHRKGFAKMAIKSGASLVPVFSFGENDLYQQADNPKGSSLRKFQEFFKHFIGFSPPIFYGRGVFNYSFGLLPFRTPVHTVVGAPLHVDQCDEPTDELVSEVHLRYITALSDLFDTHKSEYGVDGKKKLEFI